LDDLDRTLERLGQVPMPSGFEAMEANVFARIAAGSAARVGLRIGPAVFVVAALMGVMGAGLPLPSTAAASLAPLGPAQPLAPSTLLIGEP
jgi:predicted cobalt transporter CbtA